MIARASNAWLSAKEQVTTSLSFTLATCILFACSSIADAPDPSASGQSTNAFGTSPTLTVGSSHQLSAEPGILTPANVPTSVGHDGGAEPVLPETLPRDSATHEATPGAPPTASAADTAPPAPEPSSEDARLLFLPEPHSARTEIRMCWQASAYPEGELAELYAEGRAQVEAAIEESWALHSWIVVHWAEDCSQGGIPVEILDRRSSADRRGMVLNFTFTNYITTCAPAARTGPDPTWTYCVRSLAVHEFGHVLGFDHEQNKSPEGITCNDGSTRAHDVGNYLIKGNLPEQPIDTSSVMSYCQEGFHDTLSAGDIETVGALYGADGRHVLAGARYALRSGTRFVFAGEQDANAAEQAPGTPVQQSQAIEDTFMIERVGGSELGLEALQFGDQVRILREGAALCALDAATGDAALAFRDEHSASACVWLLLQGEDDEGDHLVDVNDPVRLVLASTVSAALGSTALGADAPIALPPDPTLPSLDSRFLGPF